MTEDYKHLVNPPPPPPKGPSPWLVMVAGVAVGALVAGGVAVKMLGTQPAGEGSVETEPSEPEKKPEKKAEKRGIAMSTDPVKVEDMPPGTGLPNPPPGGAQGQGQPQTKRPSFDFYTILPELESIVSDSELSRANPQSGVGSQVIQGMPPANAPLTASATPAPAIQPVLPPTTTAYQPQPGVGMVPPTAPSIPPHQVSAAAPAAVAAVPPGTPAPVPPKAPTPPPTAAAATPPVAPQVTPPVPSETSVYTLQFGSFRNGTDADRVRGELALLGVSADVQQVKVDNQVYFRVRSGPYNGNSISRVQQRLSQHNIQHIVMKAK